MTAPGEFRYWEVVNRPAVQRLRRAWQTVLRFDPQPDDEYVRRFAAAYYDTDPVAEQFVADVYDALGPRAGRDMLDQAIEHGIDTVPDAPESMRALFAEFEQDPQWLDPAKVELGAKVFRRWGTALFKFATASTLDMYTESSIAKPLALSGGYTSGRAQHRQLETIRFWIDVSEPGGLDPGGAGRATSMRVRVMHVFIRRRLMEHPEWDLAAWGRPISVGDATLTLMGGSIVPGLGLWSIGHQTTLREIEALLHFWRYIGHLLGVQPDWYPENVRQSLHLMYAAFVKRAYSAGADGAELIEAYLPAFAPAPDLRGFERLLHEIDYRSLVGYTRFWMAPWRYNSHSMPNPWPWALTPLIQAPFFFVFEFVRRVIPAVDRLFDRWQRRRREAWYQRQMGERAAEFMPAEQLRR
jgi:hypothetical protein